MSHSSNEPLSSSSSMRSRAVSLPRVDALLAPAQARLGPLLLELANDLLHGPPFRKVTLSVWSASRPLDAGEGQRGFQQPVPACDRPARSLHNTFPSLTCLHQSFN